MAMKFLSCMMNMRCIKSMQPASFYMTPFKMGLCIPRVTKVSLHYVACPLGIYKS